MKQDVGQTVVSERAAEAVGKCVHCGFCLPACPTYALWGEEMDSPRGRIDLVKGLIEGEVPPGGAVRDHLDACLGCMACVSACPSGVRYDYIVEAARSAIEERSRRPLADRLFRSAIFSVFPRPSVLRAAAVAGWIYRSSGLSRRLSNSGALKRLPARVGMLESLLPDVPLKSLLRRAPAASRSALQPPRRRVGLVLGCVGRVFFSEVNEATIRALTQEGCEVVAPPQGCCGALALHVGKSDLARAQAKAMVDAWESTRVDTIVVNAAGCGSTLKDYADLLEDDPSYAERARALASKVRDVTELLGELEPLAERHPLDLRIAYHDACHLAHAQGIREQPRSILSAIPGVELVEPAGQGTCCGSAGVYNLLQPEAATTLGEERAEAIRACEADAIATANPGCALQLARHAGLPVFHPVEIVDASIRNVSSEKLLARGLQRPT